MCAINNIYINPILVIFCIIEYTYTNNIMCIKNISYVFNFVRYLYSYNHTEYFRCNCGLYFLGIIIKIIRDNIYDKYNFMLTLLWHILCVYYIYVFS